MSECVCVCKRGCQYVRLCAHLVYLELLLLSSLHTLRLMLVVFHLDCNLCMHNVFVHYILHTLSVFHNFFMGTHFIVHGLLTQSFTHTWCLHIVFFLDDLFTQTIFFICKFVYMLIFHSFPSLSPAFKLQTFPTHFSFCCLY